MALTSALKSVLPSDMDAEEFEKRCKGVEDILNVFASLLHKRYIANQADMLKTSKYDVANWAYLQADSIGYQRALDETVNLLNFKD